MDAILETHRLYLRQLTLADTQHLFDLDSDPKVMRYMRGMPCKSLQEAQMQLQHDIDEYESVGFSRWESSAKAMMRLLGFVAFGPFLGTWHPI